MRKILIPTLFAVSLVVAGCTSTPSKKKKDSTSNTAQDTSSETHDSTSSPVLTSDTSTTSTISATSVAPGTSGTSGTGTSATSEVPPTGEFTVSIPLAGPTFVNESGFPYSGGVEINSKLASAQTNFQKYLTYIRNKAGDDNVITSAVSENTWIQYSVNGDIITHTTLGTAKNNGYFTWNSDYLITKVEAHVRPYWKYNGSTGSNNHDPESEFLIDGVSHILVNVADSEIPEIQTVEYTPPTGAKTFTMRNGGTDTSRIFVEELVITFFR